MMKSTNPTAHMRAFLLALFALVIASFASAQTSTPAETPKKFEVQRFLPPLDKGKSIGGNFALFIGNEMPNAKGVLLLCVNSMGRVALEELTTRSEWLAFANENSFGLVIVSIGHDRAADKTKIGYRADKGLGDWVTTCIDRAYGEGLPVYLYGEMRGGTFASSLLNWNSTRFKAWAGYTNQWFEKPAKIKEPPPGILAFDREASSEAKTREMNARVFYTEARKSEWPLLRIEATIPFKERKRAIAAFAREFFTSIINDNPKTSSLWIALKKRAKANLEIFGPRDEITWLPKIELLEHWKHLTNPSITPEDSDLGPVKEVVIETNNPLQPQLRMFLRLPEGKQGDEVDGVFAFCSWEGKREQILQKIVPDRFEAIEVGNQSGMKDLANQLIAFAERNNLAVLTWETAQVWSLKPSYYDEKEEEDRLANFDAMAVAWEAGVSALAQQTGIPETGYLMFGISRGAQWAHRLALRKPEHFIAVQFHVASTFDKPTPEGARLLWLISTGEREGGYRNGDASKFYDECRRLNYPAIFKVSRGLGHDDNLETSLLRESFFTYAISVRDKMQELQFEKPSDVALKEITEAPWIGDYTTYKVVPAKAAAEIPENYRVGLPTAEFVKAWSGRPAPKIE